MVDTLGQVMLTQCLALSAGTHELPFDFSGFAGDVYILQLTNPNWQFTTGVMLK
jgi:hypothetical protein